MKNAVARFWVQLLDVLKEFSSCCPLGIMLVGTLLDLLLVLLGFCIDSDVSLLA